VARYGKFSLANDTLLPIYLYLCAVILSDLI